MPKFYYEVEEDTGLRGFSYTDAETDSSVRRMLIERGYKVIKIVKVKPWKRIFWIIFWFVFSFSCTAYLLFIFRHR